MRCHLRTGEHERSLILFNFHLGLAGYERRIQLRRLLTDESYVRTHHATPLILGGDLNDVWGTLGRRSS